MNPKLFASIAVVITGFVLLYGVSDFPGFGDPRSPANAGVEGGSPSASVHYINEAYRDTKVPNIVTVVLADYRSYDTMFETVVVFAAGMAIFAILRSVGRDEEAGSRWQQLAEEYPRRAPSTATITASSSERPAGSSFRWCRFSACMSSPTATPVREADSRAG